MTKEFMKDRNRKINQKNIKGFYEESIIRKYCSENNNFYKRSKIQKRYGDVNKSGDS